MKFYFNKIKILASKSCDDLTEKFASQQSYSNCLNYDKSHEFYCSTGEFSSTKGGCSADNANRFALFNGSGTWNVKKSILLTLNNGYNLFTQTDLDSTNMIYIKSGWVLAIQALIPGSLALDSFETSNAQDFVIKGVPIFSNPAILYNLKSPHNLTKSRLLVNSQIVRDQIYSNFKKFLTIGNKSCTFSMRDNNNTIKYQKYATVEVLDKIFNLTIKSSLTCSVNQSCNFEGKADKGTGITYCWAFGQFATVNTTETSVIFAFPINGTFPVRLVAVNHVSNETTQVYINITLILEELYFFSGNGIESTSITGDLAKFSFKIGNVKNYNCSIDFGDTEQILILTQTPIDYNNDFITHLYTDPDVYLVSITCTGNNYYQSKNLTHYVQNEITKIVLLENGTDSSTSVFRIGFSCDSGTNLSVELYLDSSLDPGLIFEKSTLIGFSSYLNNAGSPYVINVTIIAENLVSKLIFSQYFEISSYLVGPELTITPTGFETDLYEFTSTPLSYSIKIQKGSNVRIKMFFGDELDPTVPSFDQIFPGNWSSDFIKPYTHSRAGDFNIKVIISNMFANFIINRKLTFISNIDKLNAYATPNPAILTFQGAFVAFKFNNIGLNHPGSRAYLKFWPGDALNSTYGSFLLGMDSKENKIPFSYNYKTSGVCKAILCVENPISSKCFEIDVNIVSGVIDDFYLDVRPPAVQPNQNFDVYGFLVAGDNVILTWNFDANIISKNRTCNLDFSLKFLKNNFSTE